MSPLLLFHLAVLRVQPLPAQMKVGLPIVSSQRSLDGFWAYILGCRYLTMHFLNCPTMEEDLKVH
jgi:hypothetical protein